MRASKGRQTIVRRLAWGVMAGVLGCAAALSQDPQTGGSGSPQTAPGAGGHGDRRGQFAGMQHVMGEVTAVNGNTITLKAEDGSSVSVVTTENTRLREDRGPVKVGDLHPGDGMMALGVRDPNAPVLHAAMVFAQTAAEIKAMHDNLGKTYITGRVTAVDLDTARMTVERPDHVAQTIGFDETTSFKRAVRPGGGNGGPGGNGNGGEGTGEPGSGGPPGPGAVNASPEAGGMPLGGGGGMGMGGMALNGGIDRAFRNGESITLADIKVGDNVAGTGSMKNGSFVPTRLVDSPPRPHRPHPGGGGASNSSGAVHGVGSSSGQEPGSH